MTQWRTLAGAVRLLHVPVLAAVLLLPACSTAMPHVAEPALPAVVERPPDAVTSDLPLGEPLPVPVREASPVAAVLEAVDGEATYYASRFDGRTAASGIVFRNDQPWAAHPSWPFGTRVRVTNLRNSRSVEVIIVDRGPFGATARRRGTIIDLSQSAARTLDFIRAGRTPVLVEVLEWGS